MNILFLFEAPIKPTVGGVQRVTEVLTKEFQRRGYNVYFLAYSYEYMMDYQKFVAPQFYIDAASLSKNDIQFRLSEIINENNINIVVSQNLQNNRILKLLPDGLKIVSVCHTQPFLCENITRKHLKNIKARNLKEKCFKLVSVCFPALYRKHMEVSEKRDTKTALQISDKVCYISSRFWDRIVRHVSSFPQEKFVAINNPNTFSAVSDLSSIKKENLIIWVGRVNNENKNAIGFIRMWQLFQKKNPTWHTIIIGHGRDLENNRNYVKRNNVQNIELIGRQDNVEDYYARAKFVVVTSWSESWCMSITEGMVFGCVPCVFGTYETVFDMITDGESGIITKPTEKDMAECLQYYVDNETQREQLSRNAIEMVKHFDVSIIANQWLDLFQGL